MKFTADYITDRFTEDGLRLPLFHFEPETEKDLCVVHIHGMCGSLVADYFGSVWGELFRQAGIGYLFVNDRGYGYINNLDVRGGGFRQVGTMRERIGDSVYDIDLGIDTALELGYRRILLLGHSIGCNKVLHYCALSRRKIDGIIFASIADVPGYVWSQPHFREVYALAEQYAAEGHPEKYMPETLDDYYYFTAETVLDWFGEDTILNGFPVNALNKTDNWGMAEKLTVPVFTFSGGLEPAQYHRLDLVKEKAVNCPDFEYAYVEGGDHYYRGHEPEAAELILDWIGRKF